MKSGVTYLYLSLFNNIRCEILETIALCGENIKNNSVQINLAKIYKMLGCSIRRLYQLNISIFYR